MAGDHRKTELDELRTTLATLEVKQRQQERQLSAWRSAASTAAAAAAVSEAILAAEAAQLEQEATRQLFLLEIFLECIQDCRRG